LKEYGIPTEIRKAGNAMQWYEQNVRSKTLASILEPFEKSVCFICMEKDINNYNRKVILETLLTQGIKGKDLALR
jgi:xanthine dehydrogenase molybdopterin-binding subunit B